MKARTKKQNPHLSPLSIPSGESGNVRVLQETYPPGTKVMVNNLRNQMFQGQQGPANYVYDFPTVWHQLLIDGGRMMSDWPIEQVQIDAAVKPMSSGRVLVGGLGLGYAASIIAKRRHVKEVTVVEINPHVVKLVASHLHSSKIKVVEADLFDYLKSYDGPAYDYAFYDIWASDGEGTFHNTVVPLYALSEGKVRTQPVNWNESVMRGQLFSGLQSRLLMMRMPDSMKPKGWDKMRPLWQDDPDADNIWHNWAVPFWQWWQTKCVDDNCTSAMHFYAHIYGRWSWRDLWAVYIRSERKA